MDTEAARHVWEMHEIVLYAAKEYSNPYTQVDVWADLEGPGFKKRVYGFWDGGGIFKVRVAATAPGVWKWTSGSNQQDCGLNDRSGAFSAIEWTEAEKRENPCRRGFIRPTENGHAFQYADGTPYFLLGDTWWSAPSFRYKWHDDGEERPVGREMGFKDMVRYRKRQGYNCIAMLAAHPTWVNDRYPPLLVMDDERRTTIRDAWRQAGTDSSKDMHNEGGRPFLFPGKVKNYEDVVPDFDRINPDYFRYMDMKVAYLNENGFVPFIEAARRDVSQVWRNYYDWPASYARYVQYVFARNQAYNCLLSPIHFDYSGSSIPSREYNGPANLVVEKYGPPPFGTLLGTNAAPSTLANFGGPDEAKWLTFHQTGNWREHDHYWYLTEIYRSSPAMPAINGEPYYPGFPDDNPPADSEEAEYNCRSGMYGSFLSGGLGGYIYGVQGIWGGDIEPEAKYRMWEALEFRSGGQVRHLLDFVSVEGGRYADLIPDAELVTPNKTGSGYGYRGWAYCAATREKDFLLLYFEKGCPQAVVRGIKPNTPYEIKWFEPITGKWAAGCRTGPLVSDQTGRMALPAFMSDQDWGLCLKELT
jgi:hypothetical protein